MPPLFYCLQVPLSDALCGGKIIFTQLDGRKLVVETKPGEVIKPDQWVCIEEEGMPIHGHPFDKVRPLLRPCVPFPP